MKITNDFGLNVKAANRKIKMMQNELQAYSSMKGATNILIELLNYGNSHAHI